MRSRGSRCCLTNCTITWMLLCLLRVCRWILLYSVSSGTTASFLPQSKDVWVGLNGNFYFSAGVNVSVVLCWWLTRSRRCCGADLLSSGRKSSPLTWLPLPGTPRFLSRRQLHVAADFLFVFKTSITPLTQRAGTSAHAATLSHSHPSRRCLWTWTGMTIGTASRNRN